MAAEEMDDQYFIYENRLSSFHGPQPVHKRRASTAGSRAPKALTWPHKSIAAADMARAGFYFNPRPSNPDNVACFLCRKELDGWEEDDEPLVEHLKHSPDCGWAICAAIEVELGDVAREDPRQPHLLEARKATFAGRWPYEGKKGWKCKTKQLAEAGWKYTPTLESDDHTTCAYCQLALDGWEPGDKPMDEHQRRSPDCPYFALISQGPAPKKTARGKAARSSKASRMSIQSVATTTSEAPSVSELAADHEDSIMTTTSVATAGGRKAPKGRKAAGTAKGRKTRTKKEDAVEVHEDAEAEAEMPPPPKPTRGRKRASEAVEDSVLTNAEAPAPKKRATRARASHAADTSVMTNAAAEPDVEMTEAAPAKPKATGGRKKGRASTTKRTRKGSTASVASTASTASLRAGAPDDEELERQLQEDMDRPLTDDEHMAIDSDSERKKAPQPTKTKGKRVVSKKMAAQKHEEANEDFAMFNPAPAEPDEAQVDAELKALEAEMQVDEEPQEIKVPKKGRKPGVRKASKQTKKQTVPEPELEPEGEVELVEPEPIPEPEPEPVVEPEITEDKPAEPEIPVDHDISMASTDTVVKGGAGGRLSNGKRGRGRPPKKSRVSEEDEAEAAQQLVQEAAEAKPPVEQAAPEPRGRGRPKKISRVSEVIIEDRSRSASREPPQPEPVAKQVPVKEPAKRGRKSGSAAAESQAQAASVRSPPVATTPAKMHKALPKLPVEAEAPATPGKKQITPAHSAKQATLSPSQSPQSSDAENRPPSSKPASSAKRPVLATLETCTPVRDGSPSKRANVIGGLQSTTPWTTVDLEAVFSMDESNNKENGDIVARMLAKGSDLASPERLMTVEEWIYHNAGKAEQQLKHECETMVSAFEKEGSRAMRVLEGIVVD
ncbi:uncharacterized protein E0L32_000284 [Thyridium curvatum]|uniref:Uncharacterized protein n=1 Tax=Thyridium curvatum TaxID=1093900 RepID=A0A507BHC2_9PEZI|nr:uncharacterized protein E0L32_000284 [Thyridium curvatum]TPX15950.1 hypothetical protein E0L32_000284 [Thyridium curvatum]